MRHPLTPTYTLALISLVLVGCASTKDAVLPRDGPSMQAIYEQHITEMNARDPLAIRRELGERPVVTGDTALHGYTRDAGNEVDAIFARLPNPILVMYVFPHLAGGAPVPGYATAFPLYEGVEYALPGEVPAQSSGGSR